jgi:hypothetical protein
MECDICGQEVGNSEELEKHKERLHAAGGGDNLEMPDMLGNSPEESAARESPQPIH